jgi:hypothetical protein
MKRLFCVFVLLLLCLVSPASAAGIPTPAVGDIVVFGSYEQDNQLDNGQEPLEWIVLDVQDNKAMLLSKYCIDTVIFYPKRVPMYWGKSDLRTWMNGDFLQEAFTAEEQECILTTTVKNDNPHGMKGGSADTLDKIYLLSKSEVLHFFPECADRVAYPTEYAKSKGCTVSPTTGSCRWWTRTPAPATWTCAACVLTAGSALRHAGRGLAYQHHAPVMWVQCED